MMDNRRWITREEIAEIHEAIAMKPVTTVSGQEEMAMVIAHSNDHLRRAKVIRELDKVSH